MQLLPSSRRRRDLPRSACSTSTAFQPARLAVKVISPRRGPGGLSINQSRYLRSGHTRSRPSVGSRRSTQRQATPRTHPGGRGWPWSGDNPIHLKNLGVLAVHVDAVRPRDVPDVLGVRVPPVLLRRVMRQRRHLPLQVALLERDVPLVPEVEVVPRDLVAEGRRALEGPQALVGDRAVVLVDVVQARLEDDVRPPLLPERYQ